MKCTSAILLFLAIVYAPLRSMSAGKSTTSVRAGLGMIIDFFKPKDQKTNSAPLKIKISSRDIEFKDSVDLSKLSFCLIRGDVVMQLFKQSDNLTRLKYRRINKVWNQAIQMYAEGCIETLDTNDERTIGEKLTGKPEKIVFKNHNAQMLTSLMRSGAMQYTGIFDLGKVQGNETGTKLLSESLKNQYAIFLSGRNNTNDFDMPGLISGLASNTQLTTLQLHANFLRKNDQEALVKLAHQNTSLKNLIIWPNYSPDNTIATNSLDMNFVAKILNESSTLQTLALYHTPYMTNDDARLLLDSLARNKTLQKIYISSALYEAVKAQLEKESRIIFDYPP